ncbi:MAG: SBBP repeat-containing protein [Bacteroidota bacterium]
MQVNLKYCYKQPIYILVFTFCLITNLTHAQQFNWAKQVGQISFDEGYTIALDNDNCVYTAGYFSTTVDFDPGAGIYNLYPTNQGGNEAYVLKLDSAGNFKMAFSFGGYGNDEVRSIKVDQSKNIYVTGTYQDTADFDPSLSTYNLTPSGNESVFVAKYDSTGALLWAKSIAASYHVYASAMDIDQAGSVYVTGNFLDTVDFDPGPNIYQLTTNSMYDAYVLKLNTNGDFCWAYDIGQTTLDLGYDIEADNFGAVYTVGTFRNSVDFNPGAGNYILTSAGSDDVFILKLDTAGSFIWAKAFGGPSTDYGRGISVDDNGNIITTGSFLSTADFNPGPGVFNITQSGNAGEDIFISKLDSAGNFIWAKQFGGVGAGFGAGIATDLVGNVYATGHFDGVTDFNCGAGVLNFTQIGLSGADIYIVKLDAQGNFLWAKQVGGTTYDYGYEIAPDAFGNVYYTGFFEGTVDFNPNTGIYNLISGGAHDIFVSKLGGTLTANHEIAVKNTISAYPNPVSDILSINIASIDNADCYFSLVDTQGQLVYQSFNKDTNVTSIDVKNIPEGLYILSIASTKWRSNLKLAIFH